MAERTNVAIIGSGNIGTDLMFKIKRLSPHLAVHAMAGIDPDSDGLARAARLGVDVTAEGVEGLIAMDGFDDIALVFDATTADSHARHQSMLEPFGKRMIDLTPAAIGPFVVPAVNLIDHLAAPNVNMVTCGGQATIPIVAALSSVTTVHYAEIVASIASRSAGPGTRANIDEFTETTARGLESVGGAARGKAIIVLNPAEPPITMRDSVFCLTSEADPRDIIEAVGDMVARVSRYVPGFRLKQPVQLEPIGSNVPTHLPNAAHVPNGTKVSVLLEVAGAAHYLPSYAGNLDIMTSAALQTGEAMTSGRVAW